jgi:hypothetical protein
VDPSDAVLPDVVPSEVVPLGADPSDVVPVGVEPLDVVPPLDVSVGALEDVVGAALDDGVGEAVEGAVAEGLGVAVDDTVGVGVVVDDTVWDAVGDDAVGGTAGVAVAEAVEDETVSVWSARISLISVLNCAKSSSIWAISSGVSPPASILALSSFS